MFQFCKGNIQNIIFRFISKTDVDNTGVILNERFERVTRIPGTRSFHEFSPIHEYSIEMKRTSEDKEPTYPAGNYIFKVNNRNTRTRCAICSKLTINIPERRHWGRSGIFIVNFEYILHLVLLFLLLTLSR